MKNKSFSPTKTNKHAFLFPGTHQITPDNSLPLTTVYLVTRPLGGCQQGFGGTEVPCRRTPSPGWSVCSQRNGGQIGSQIHLAKLLLQRSFSSTSIFSFPLLLLYFLLFPLILKVKCFLLWYLRTSTSLGEFSKSIPRL